MSETTRAVQVVGWLPRKWDAMGEWLFRRQTNTALLVMARAIKKLQTEQAEKEAASAAIRAQVTLLEQFKKLAEAGGTVTRDQAAALLNTSTKKIQRLQIKGKLQPCPELLPLVRYPAGDVLRLASANGR